MRLFLSYARVDKPYCVQVVDTLDVHEVWYDQRLYAGQDWWKEILQRLDWCEGFIYLLSPDSVASEYCRKEYELAKMLGRPIFPVIIREHTLIPDDLAEVQYIDLSKGISSEAVKVFLNSIYMAERRQHHTRVASTAGITDDRIIQPPANSSTVVSLAAKALENGQYDQAVFLLKQAKANGYGSRYVDLDALLKEAEAALNRQSYLLDAEREYRQILDLVNVKATRVLGLDAFNAFRRDFPNYDPENIARIAANGSNGDKPRLLLTGGKAQAAEPSFVLPLLEWCDITSGKVEINYPSPDGRQVRKDVNVTPFRISKYPVTNAQYQAFIDDPDGYDNTSWWEFSKDALNSRLKHPQSRPSRFKGPERPREMVSWYDALAFCNWLGSKLDTHVTLATAAQWQRAFQGDDRRSYPWGNQFDSERCNSAESNIKMTTIVTRYPNGASPFGVFDMAANTWEWCIDGSPDANLPLSLVEKQKRVVRGGSFMSSSQRACVDFFYVLDPESYHASIGFRLVQS